MVMRKNMMRKNLLRSIRRSLGRYIAIVAIIALGAGMFVGLRTTKSDMVATGQQFMDRQNMFDLRLLSSYGWSPEHVDAVSKMDGVEHAEGVISMDVLARFGDTDDEAVYKLYTLPRAVNQVLLLGGRMPQAPDECLADGFHATDAILGTKVTVAENNEADVLESLTERTFTVVGYVSTPLYMDMSRGNTALGNGTVTSYLYLPRESFDVDYYAEINVALSGESTIYSAAYNNAMKEAAKRFEKDILPLAIERLETLRAEAESAYADGLAEYEDGKKEFDTAKAEALKELDEALQKLKDGEKEIAANRKTIDSSLKLLEDGQDEIDQNRLALNESRQTLAETKAETYAQLAKANGELLANYKTVSENLRLLEDGLVQINDGLDQIESGISQLEDGLEQLNWMLTLVDTMMSVVNTGIDTAQAALDRAEQTGVDAATIARLRKELQTYIDQRDEYAAQQKQMHDQQAQYTAQLEELKVQKQGLTQQRTQLLENKKTLDDAMAAINAGFLELQNSQTQAENQFAAAEAQIEAGELQLNAAQQELDANRKKLEEGRKELEAAEAELAHGWQEYNTGYEQAMEELNEAEAELADAAQQLADARKAIDEMTNTEVYALDRTTNVGYVSLDSNSDIVEAVSAVFPAFFLLIAALVCITTMTRMVEEERTQIGTLKALGYSNGAIIGKYLAYAGSAAVLGCGLGVFIGSAVFPMILWEAYSIMMLLTPNIVLRIDWPLCLAVVGAYTAVTLFVTWYACRMSLREVPAELIRPKPPTSGKKIFLEYLPFWNKFSFLNKVMLRNIFRYRQRLLMMLVGIGGCTALLLTGFGFRDSIVDVVSYQFEEITLYDMEVRFSEEVTTEDQAAFRQEMDGLVDDMTFYHQSSVELDFGDKTKDIVLIAGDDRLEDFMDFHSGKTPLDMPDQGQALLSVGVAENLGISVGDTVTVRNSDLQTLTVTVSGIYDNHVSNYVIVTPETVEDQWGKAPKVQVACVTVHEDQDVYEASAKASECSGVMSVSVNQDMADQVGKMLEALDMIVVVVVICAGMLAVIVLYNLTNINITERVREIATIKVLGFNAAESAAYVFKENLLLSAMGAVLGLGGGILLLEFVMSKIRIDMVWFQARLLPLSFVLSIVLTMLAACLVDFVLYFKLEKINMAEALKSVE